MKIYIHNSKGFHYEVIESVICKYDQIVGVHKSEEDEVVLGLQGPKNSKDFSEYIINKYPHIKFLGYTTDHSFFPFCNDADYYIECSMYGCSFLEEYADENKYFYINHAVNKRLKDSKNVFYLTPLGGERYIYADILPWSDSMKMSDTPTYIIQGAYTRRNWGLIKQVLDCEELKNLPFKIKVVGHGVGALPFTDRRLIIKSGLPFREYHKQFLDCYCIMPLITKKEKPEYYTNKLTSSISYARAYNLKTLLDEDLQNIYNLKNAEVYDHPDHFVEAFHKTLKDFIND